jgi:two-component sensor histidine kinase
MLLILSFALFPLGLIAMVASVQNAQEKNAERREETLARLEIKAQRLNSAFSRSVLTIGTASTALASTPESGDACANMLRWLERVPKGVRYSLYADGRLRCASSGFNAPPASLRGEPGSTQARIDDLGSSLRMFVFAEDGSLEGTAEYPRAVLSELSYIPGTTPNFDLDLVQGSRRMVLRAEFADGPLRETVRGTEAVADGQLQLRIRLSALPISAADVLLILLPVFMWMAAGAIGWLIAERLLLRPLVRMQRAVAAYRPGDRELALPSLATPAHEINELGRSFDDVVRTVARHEAELEAAVERQTRLVREVHHRVKNNLQVVASLLNIHSRGAPNEEVAAAYASIQRRVDALAVVHRNHYAELEENRGVALKPLISELAANLRATAPPASSGMVIRLDLEPYYATQDVAVSVAFLITEIVEYTMFCGAPLVTISLTGESTGPGTAALSVESESLRPAVTCEATLTERFERIVTGLSRQLRSAIRRDPETGRYCLDIAVVDKAER